MFDMEASLCELGEHLEWDGTFPDLVFGRYQAQQDHNLQGYLISQTIVSQIGQANGLWYMIVGCENDGIFELVWAGVSSVGPAGTFVRTSGFSPTPYQIEVV